MKKAEKFRDMIKTILIEHFDQTKFRSIVDLMFDEIYKDEGKK